MTPLLLVVAGLVVLGAGVAILWSFGSRYRVGRLLAATRRTSVADAIGLARSGSHRFVRVDGRIDSEQDFPDEHHRPLVYRRRRLQLRRGRDWQTYDEQLEQVPFEIREGLDGIGIDSAAIGDGLVVLPREAEGIAREVPESVPPGTPPDTPIRMRLEQVSAVEHAIVLGVPVDQGGTVRLTAGLGRPLIVTTLEPHEAMRVLGGGPGTIRPLAAVACLVAGMVLLTGGLALALVDAVG